VEFGDFNHGPPETPMTKTTMDLSEFLQKHDQGDLLRSIAEAVLQLIMEFKRKKSIQWIDFSEE
jgi:putative transposase